MHRRLKMSQCFLLEQGLLLLKCAQMKAGKAAPVIDRHMNGPGRSEDRRIVELNGRLLSFLDHMSPRLIDSAVHAGRTKARVLYSERFEQSSGDQIFPCLAGDFLQHGSCRDKSDIRIQVRLSGFMIWLLKEYLTHHGQSLLLQRIVRTETSPHHIRRSTTVVRHQV